MDTKHDSLITRLHDEADLCRNDGVPETAKLLDEAIARIEELERALQGCVGVAEGKRMAPGESFLIIDQARALLTKKD